MVTKEEFCWMIINNFKQQEKIFDIDDADMLKSSQLAVAMEYLGLIEDQEMKDYAESRGGTICLGRITPKGEDIKTLSARDILSLLPV